MTRTLTSRRPKTGHRPDPLPSLFAADDLTGLDAFPAPQTATQPFLKWAGGKRQLLPDLMTALPLTPGRYFEPFLGGGALFFHRAPEFATLSDTNQRLIRTYRAIRDEVEAVIARLSTYPNDPSFYRTLRDQSLGGQIDAEDDITVAAWFIYLNRTCYNGVYRVNKKNEFNMPFGRYKNPAICNPALLRQASALLQGQTILHRDFREIVGETRKGDTVYLDPPYHPISENANFTRYTAGGFSEGDQRDLAAIFFRMKARGVRVLLSNSDTPFIRALYQEATLTEVTAQRFVSCTSASRGPVTELLIS